MKIYDYDTIFIFGKHKGKRLIDVVTTDWDYINWCQENIPNFIFSENMLYVLKEPNGSFKFSKQANEKRERNLRLLHQQRADSDSAREERFQELQNEADQSDFEDYDPYSEESGGYNNSPNFNTEPFDDY